MTCGESLANPIDHAQAFARDHHVILLLKGTATVVTDGQETYLINRGSGGMATAGSGDVLSGILAGVLGYCPPTAKTPRSSVISIIAESAPVDNSCRNA